MFFYWEQKTNKKCAIGRYIKPEDYDIEIENKTVTADTVFNRLPEELKQLNRFFLSSIQFLHDVDGNWITNGLSDEGKKKVEKIIEMYCK